jgi:hypothetical protein
MKYNFLVAVIGLIGVAGAVNARPNLEADVYVTGSVDSIAFTVNGGTPIPCSLVPVTTPIAGVKPSCDLVSITTPGTYTLVMIATKAAGCVGNTCYAGGVASSAPFQYTWNGSDVVKPVPNRLVP